jgi:hypothetical protein
MRFAIACLSIVTSALLTTACERAETPPAPDAAPAPAEQQVQEPAPTNGATTLTASMTGAEEVPGPGDADGTGNASVNLDTAGNQVCYELTVSNVENSNAAHIHSGAAGQAGPPVVNLDPPAQGSSKGCAAVDAKVIADIQQNPGGFYVNVHNAEFPGGAVRGQLAAGGGVAN